MPRSLFVVLFLICAVNASGYSVFAGDLVTITGKVAETNRDGFEPFRDAFFKYHDRSFKKAFAFDRSALLALPQRKVTAQLEGWPGPLSGKGPLLRDVLEIAGVQTGAKLTLMALDGYAAELEPADLSAHDWVLAIEANGEPLGIGGRGPAWLMYDTNDKILAADLEAKWVWSAFLIVAD